MAENTENGEKSINSIIKNDIKDCSVMKFDLEAEYSINLLRNLQQQYNQNMFCDLDLIANDGEIISVHQNILMASSCYFNAMLSSGMKENATKEIPLKDVSGEILRLLIDFCYSGKIEITSDNIETLLAAASRYEFVEIEKQCSKFLEHFLKENPLNCLAYISLAYLYQFNGLKKLSEQLLCEHFMELKDTEEILLLKFEQLLEVIKCDELSVSCEEDVYNAVMMWINYDKTNREKFMIDLFKVIRFTQMETTFLVNEGMKMTTAELKQIFNDVINYQISILKSKPISLTGYPLVPRTCIALKATAGQSMCEIESESESESDIEIFAFSHEPGSTTLHREVYNKADESWKILAPFVLPTEETIRAMIKWDRIMFVFYDEGRIIGFDMNTLVTTNSIKTPVKRKSYAAAIQNDCIYILGGQVYDGSSGLYQESSSVIKYDIQKGVWSTCASLTKETSELSATQLNETIYCHNYSYAYPHNSIECIDLNSWDLKKIEFNSNRYCNVISDNHRLYIVEDDRMDRYNLATGARKTVCQTQCSNILSNRKCNGIFRVKNNSFEIEKFVSENNWKNYGRLSKKYSNLFLFNN